MNNINYKKQKISPYLLVILSFVFIILLGAFLLTTPPFQLSGNWGTFIDSLYIAASATCVTGADCFPESIANVYTFWGQLIIALMIQIGGLGFITVLVFFVTLFKRKLSFRDRAFLSQAVNSTSYKDLIVFVRKLFIVSICIEILGMLIGLPVFLKLFSNPWEGVWNSLFISISSFNNAGFDIFGNASFIRNFGVSIVDTMENWMYYYMCTYTMLLVVLGGISYLVIFEVFSFKKKPHQWRAFTKICLVMTFILIFVGAGLLMISEGLKKTNPMNFGDAIFQSITCRTAGFATYDPYQLSTGGRIISCFLMFVGGCPLGTASGIKTTTLFILILTMYCYFRGRKVIAFKRYFSQNMIVKTMAVTITSIFVVLIGYFALVMFESSNIVCTGERAIYEVISCFSTTGFTTPLTISLSVGGKITCAMLMLIGRLGPMTMFQVFSTNMNVEEKTHYRVVEEDILIG